MRIREGIEVDDVQLAELCGRHEVVELAVFGSVLRDDFRADSDIDVLVTFAPEATPAWGGARFALELEELLGRHVDLGERQALHWVIRPTVLDQVKVLYVAALSGSLPGGHRGGGARHRTVPRRDVAGRLHR